MGENIGLSTDLNEPPTETVRRWYDEVQDYTFGPVGGSNVCSGVCGHYTQVSACIVIHCHHALHSMQVVYD